jgi:hypothetical protein
MLGPHVAVIAHRLVDTPERDRDRLEGTVAKTEQDRKSKKKEDRKSKNEDDRLSRELEMSFPASDPPAATQPGSGITGPEAANSETKADKTKDKPARRRT